MEDNLNLQDKENNKQKKLSYIDRFSDDIWKILSSPNENMIQELNYVFEKFLRLVSMSDLNDEEIQKTIFQNVFDFLNKLFEKIDIKKFYNNIPKTNIKQYSENSVWEMFLHNIYWKERKLFYRDEIEWWSCSYWTILFKRFFDELEKKWLKIKSDIFFYPNNDLEGWWWHSWLIITFQWKDYLVDFWWFNSMQDNPIMENIDVLNEKYESTVFDALKRKNIEKYYRQKNKDKSLSFFNDIESFTARWMQRGWDNATIELRPNIEWDWSKDVKISFYFDRIILNVWNDSNTFFLDTRLIKKNASLPDEKIFDLLLTSIVKQKSATTLLEYKKNKQVLEKYLKLVWEKINIQNLRKIYWIYDESVN